MIRKIPLKNLRTPEKHSNEQPLAYASTYNENNPELYTERAKNLEQLNNNDTIKNILGQTKIMKSKRK